MTETAQEAYSHSMHRGGGNSNSRNHQYAQYNSGARRSAFNGTGSGLSRKQSNFVQQGNSRPIPEVVRETGLILEVQREYGRILSQSNFSSSNIHIYFSLSTLVNDAPLSAITDNLADIFQAGAVVEIEIEGGINPKGLKDCVHVILTCISIKPNTEAGNEPELVPMVIIQDDHEVPLALIANHELVAIPRQVFPVEEVTSAFMAKKSSLTTDTEWPEFATIGRSVEGRILNAPPWIREFTNPAAKKIALSVQRFGRDREGFAVIKEHIGRGVVLMPIDEEDRKICGDLFFPYEMRTDTSRAIAECEDLYRLNSKWYFRACPELPNRRYKYRVYSLDSLEDDIVTDNSTTRKRLPEQTIVTNQKAFTADESTSAMGLATSTNLSRNNSKQLIEFDVEPLPAFSPSSALSNTAAVSSVTLNLLATIDFDAPNTTTNYINETMLMRSSTSSDATNYPSRSDLLVDFNAADDAQTIDAKVRQFHVLDDDFTLSSFHFDVNKEKKNNCEAEMHDCNHRNGENICISSQDREPENADLHHIAKGISVPKEQTLKMEDEDYSISFTAVKSKNPAKNSSVICNGCSAVEQQVNNSRDMPLIDQEVDSSSDDSEHEMFHAIPVERQDNDGWWFTRKVPSRGELVEDKKIIGGLLKESTCNGGNSSSSELASVPEDDMPLLVLTEDDVQNCETASLTVTPQLSLSNALQNDGVVDIMNLSFIFRSMPSFSLDFFENEYYDEE
uniref:Tudor domain-containing protein n=1 Tax=Setaria digitata TaxID=48799 RepID=A0A915PTZ0_9BILA